MVQFHQKHSYLFKLQRRYAVHDHVCKQGFSEIDMMVKNIFHRFDAQSNDIQQSLFDQGFHIIEVIRPFLNLLVEARALLPLEWSQDCQKKFCKNRIHSISFSL